MTWTLRLNDKALKELRKAGAKDQARILSFLTARAATRQNPREPATQLVGPDSGKWRFRVGDYRVIAIGHRREAHR